MQIRRMAGSLIIPVRNVQFTEADVSVPFTESGRSVLLPSENVLFAWRIYCQAVGTSMGHKCFQCGLSVARTVGYPQCCSYVIDTSEAHGHVPFAMRLKTSAHGTIRVTSAHGSMAAPTGKLSAHDPQQAPTGSSERPRAYRQPGDHKRGVSTSQSRVASMAR